jgi:hypothetical protein
MPSRRALAAIAFVIFIPIAFAMFGTSQNVGLIIGVVLVAIGLGATLLGSRRSEDG